MVLGLYSNLNSTTEQQPSCVSQSWDGLTPALKLNHHAFYTMPPNVPLSRVSWPSFGGI